jgi:hypothetical protein
MLELPAKYLQVTNVFCVLSSRTDQKSAMSFCRDSDEVIGYFVLPIGQFIVLVRMLSVAMIEHRFCKGRAHPELVIVLRPRLQMSQTTSLTPNTETDHLPVNVPPFRFLRA